MNFKLFKTTFLFIVLIELLSIFAYLIPEFNQISFSIIVFVVLILSLYNLRWGLSIVLAELFISSKGYLFYLGLGGLNISIRVALWLVLMSVWFSKYILTLCRCKERNNNGMIWQSRIHHYIKGLLRHPAPHNDIKSYFIPLFIFIAWGAINGLLQGNDFHNVFFDFNGWVYFSLIFPVYSVFNKNQGVSCVPKNTQSPFLNDLSAVFLASISWISIKTFILLYIFSHEMTSVMPSLYRWVRTTGVGEITLIEGGFYRIFFQSHIYVLIGFFALFSYLILKNTKNVILSASEESRVIRAIRLVAKFFTSFRMTRGEFFDYTTFNLSVLFLAVTIINFSRSNWVGLVVGLGVLFLFVILNAAKRNEESYIMTRFFTGDQNDTLVKRIYRFISIFLAITIMSFVLIIIIVKFPYPSPTGSYNAGELLTKRASQISGEAGVSSRWNLLPELWKEIKKAPILGSGFGATVTYKSNDPRVLETSINGNYTTYAFEWGWLDIWLKLGIGGLIAYSLLISRILHIGFVNFPISNFKFQILGLLIGLIVISTINFFSPYLNHPLGIGYLILIAAIVENKNGE
ncbi:hypothetical protein A2331_04500 [Candidatus Falkowbacteria bacterium RIFOXYB2_FULL_34_18]|uniref:O-antigen ligase-related domain-containing protein n=1 Tax=Candidatus Falkowbacteria bacterium RIFOXYD2_FULL_34_120 TaxID=1798007 RepID=A0A1F5TM85_9BACT|nr:MAG: hypothetical protein A2331_04500 [Candidatus Falkowbacteria bacterium RIFOXYB2_FULL_34_18]OGF30294.1 MAG: hypothetical protein A2500_06880 [Candidatus Falkowbacteria bacterium RIFOXYC12_FULL_34_55]OGF37845.1 MAG: hypothetical protein A2466_04005 [Candidatus Falkowbacteria bacterium RIFOXYC2_FULL_34_220]OGF39606.1 MAG: hypothetical protein A2515_03720 [Candidatus Falkowbacteria bacterium RIFOXYD12_FULL_34_57]OGF40030.1 MAG: hypothetical protein A2531_07450 [Candidatus Falkowbacteria bact